MHAAGIQPDEARTLDLLTRPDVDTTALFTEPTLDAWGVPFKRCEGDDDPAADLHSAIEQARAQERPVALVVSRPLN